MADIDWTMFPTRPACFGRDSSNDTCTTVTDSMIDFLNITDPWTYKGLYCVNPPTDSCAFGYCANPDIASPAVRTATYTSTICLAIVILFNPDAIVDSFYAQLLQIYSLMVAAIVAIALRQLTRLHAVFALTAAGSPLSLYLLFHALRSFFTHSVLRLDAVYGRHRGARATFNRLAVVIGLPLWITILVVIARPSRSGWFQQTACDAVFKDGLVGRFFYGPMYLLIERSTRTRILFLTPIAALIMAWIVAIVLQRKAINEYNRDVGIVRRVWRAVTDPYPFIRICTVILFPMGFWIAMMESGALFSNEYFIPTYGQILAIAAAVPPLIQCICLLPRVLWWFVDLTWVRYVTGRKNAPYHHDPAELAPGSYHNMYDGKSSSGSAIGEYSKLDNPKVESLEAGVPPQNRYSHASVSSAASDATVIPLHNLEDKSHFDSSAFPTPPAVDAPAPYSTGKGYSPSNENHTYSGGGGTQAPPRARTPDSGSVQGGFVDPYDEYRRA